MSSSRLAAYLASLQGEFPGLRLVDKERDLFSRLIHIALVVVTLGAQRSYLRDYVTTIGTTVYLPTSWVSRSADDQYITLRHEAVHLRQFRRLGLLGMSLLYLLGGLPLGLAWGRSRLEWEAYRETLAAVYEVHGPEAARDAALHQRIVRQFVSGAYGWMWPFPDSIRRRLREALAELDAGEPNRDALRGEDETGFA